MCFDLSLTSSKAFLPDAWPQACSRARLLEALVWGESGEGTRLVGGKRTAMVVTTVVFGVLVAAAPVTAVVVIPQAVRGVCWCVVSAGVW